MANSKKQNRPELIVRPGQQLVQVPDEENGKPITRVYVRDVNELSRDSDNETLRVALSTVGAWSALDWEETEAELDRIRHEGQPGWYPQPYVRAKIARSLAGAWTDLDWDETVEALDRIRHESGPSLPIDDV
jgi:hypothetical protein